MPCKGPFKYYFTQGGMEVSFDFCDNVRKGVGGLLLHCDVTFFKQLYT